MKIPGLIILTYVLSVWADKTILTEFDELEKLVENYDRRVRPNAGGPPVTVKLSVYVLNIPYINFGKHGMEITVDMYFRQFWDDPRLQIDKSLNMPKILGEKEIVDKIWVPDTFFVNEHSSLAKENFLRISDGEVLWSQRMQVTFTTSGDYSRFPFDSQVFPLEFESFKYTSKDVRFGWKLGSHSVQLSPGLGFTDLSIVGHRQMEVVTSLDTGDYSRLWIEIQVDRNSTFYFSILFVPLFLITIISFTTFWMDINQRLVFLLVLNISIIGYKLWFRVSMLPPVSYSVCAVEYIDMCLAITLLVLIENIAITSLRHSSPSTSACHVELENINMDEESNIQVLKPNSVHNGHKCFGIYFDHYRIDSICKFFIPVLFIFLQVCFWIHLATMEKQELEGIIGVHD